MTLMHNVLRAHTALLPSFVSEPALQQWLEAVLVRCRWRYFHTYTYDTSHTYLSNGANGLIANTYIHI